MKNGLLILAPLAVLIASGCNPEQPAKSPVAGEPKATETANQTPGDSKLHPTSVLGGSTSTDNPPKINNGASSKPGEANTEPNITPSPSSPPSQAVSLSSIPADLKHEGFDYAGVTRTAPLDMEEVVSTNPSGAITGAQTITCTSVKDGKAVFTIDRTGGLANLGSETWTITKDGVYSKSSIVDVGDNAMELPAVPKPGMTWKVHMKADRPDAKMDMDNTFKIVGKEKVTTKGGTFTDALLVEQIGTGTLQAKKARTVSRSWYVKGLGLVKADMKVTFNDGTSQTVTVQETNPK